MLTTWPRRTIANYSWDGRGDELERTQYSAHNVFILWEKPLINRAYISVTFLNARETIQTNKKAEWWDGQPACVYWSCHLVRSTSKYSSKQLPSLSLVNDKNVYHQQVLASSTASTA